MSNTLHFISTIYIFNFVASAVIWLLTHRTIVAMALLPCNKVTRIVRGVGCVGSIANNNHVGHAIIFNEGGFYPLADDATIRTDDTRRRDVLIFAKLDKRGKATDLVMVSEKIANELHYDFINISRDVLFITAIGVVICTIIL